MLQNILKYSKIVRNTHKYLGIFGNIVVLGSLVLNVVEYCIVREVPYACMSSRSQSRCTQIIINSSQDVQLKVYFISEFNFQTQSRINQIK